MLYFTLLVLFLVLIIGPVIVRRFIKDLPNIPMNLQQPTGQDNNDTLATVTGSVLQPGLAGGVATGGGGGGGGDSAATTAAAGGDAFESGAFGLGGGATRRVRW